MVVLAKEAVPNLLLRQAREAQNLIQDEVADGLIQLGAKGVTGNLVSKWERGICCPSRFHQRLLCRFFDATTDELGFGGGGVGTAALELLVPAALGLGPNADTQAMEAFRAADRQVGGGHLCASVVRYLQAELGPRLFGASVDESGPQLFCAAASLTDMAGWMAHDAGHDGLARRHFDRALELAALGGDRQLGAQALTSLSHLAHHLGQPQQAMAFARNGQQRLSRGPYNPELAARLLAMEARGLAAQGEAAACMQVLVQAEKVLGGEGRRALSPWVSRFDEASLASEAARCLRQLGDLGAAQRQAERVVALRSRERARSRAFGQLMLANLLVAQGELDGACAKGYEIVGGTQALGSFLVVQQLEGLRGVLEPYRSVRVVGEFLADLREALAGRAWLSQWPKLDPHCQTGGRKEKVRVLMPTFEQSPATWEHLAEGNAKQARKRVGADVILRDAAGRLLLVDPMYKPDWDLPGGMAEANEPPRKAVRREVREELGLELTVGRVLVVDWVAPHGPWDDLLMFVFDGGTLSEQQIHELKFIDGELRAFRFCTEDEAAKLLRDYVWRRVRVALEGLATGRARYVEDGREVR